MKMSDAEVSNNMRKGDTAWWQRLVWSLGAATGLLSGAAAAGSSPAAAQGGEYRAAAAAPAAWQDFARLLQSRFQQRLAADDKDARSFQDYLAKLDGDKANLAVVVRSWIAPDGKVARVEFNGLDDDAAVSLRALLVETEVSAPPAGMLQPLHLRLSLRPKEQPEQGG